MIAFIVGLILGLHPTLTGLISAILVGIQLRFLATIYLLNKDGYDVYEVLQDNHEFFIEYFRRTSPSWKEIFTLGVIGGLIGEQIRLLLT